MRHRVMVMAVLLCLAGAGCEQGWVLNGQIIVPEDFDVARPLQIVMFDLDTIPLDSGPPAWRPVVIMDEPRLPPSPVHFKYEELGCVGARVLVLAWAPPPPPPTSPTDGWRRPQPGDYTASTGWIAKTGCGYSGEQHIQLTLARVE